MKEYQSYSTRVRKVRKGFTQMQTEIATKARNKINTIDIPLQEISSQQEAQELLNSTVDSETAVKEKETSFMDERTEVETQTIWDKRDIGATLKATKTAKKQIVLALAQLAETNEHLAYDKDKLEQAKKVKDKI